MVLSVQWTAVSSCLALPAALEEAVCYLQLPHPFPGARDRTEVQNSKVLLLHANRASAAKTVFESRHRYCPRYSKRAQASTFLKKIMYTF